MSSGYVELTKDNIDEMARKTGKKPDEIRSIFDECQSFGQVQIFWFEFNRWFGTRIAGEVLMQFTVPEVMDALLRRSWPRD